MIQNTNNQFQFSMKRIFKLSFRRHLLMENWWRLINTIGVVVKIWINLLLVSIFSNSRMSVNVYRVDLARHGHVELLPHHFISCLCSFCFTIQNKTDHPISNNSYPSATANKANTALIEEGGGVTKPTGTSYYFDKVWSGAPDGRFEKLFLIRNAKNFDQSPNNIFLSNIFMANSHILYLKGPNSVFPKLITF